MDLNLGENVEHFDFQYLMDRALENVPADVDVREGSFIYDALAPACMELALMYQELRNFYHATFIQTSFDGYLDLKVAEQGLTRHQATRALRRGEFTDSEGNPFSPPVGTRFATDHPTDSIHFTTIRHLEVKGQCILECAELGIVGNDFIGLLLPVDHINGLGTARMLGIEEPAQDNESDDDLRDRFFLSVTSRAFGGNITQYRQEVLNIDGVGAVQVYPVWNGGGTVKLSILDTARNPVSTPFIETVQNVVDPRQEGLGLGIAPIGHIVTVSTPKPRNINISITVDPTSGASPSLIRNGIEHALDEYFTELRHSWDSMDYLNRFNLAVFRSQVTARLIQVEGVANIAEVLFDGEDKDVALVNNGDSQELPFICEVVINVR